MTSGIYKLTNIVNGKVYIGQSWDIGTRWENHKNRKGDYAISRAIQKYGWPIFKKEILIVAGSQEDLDLYETRCIEIYNSISPYGYNLRGGGSYGKHHPDSVASMAAKLTGRPKSAEHREKLRVASTGKVRSAESRAKQSANSTGHKNPPRSGEARANMAAARRGKVRSAESRAKQSAATRGVPRGPHSEARKAKIAEKAQGRTMSEETRVKISEAFRRRREAKAAMVQPMKEAA